DLLVIQIDGIHMDEDLFLVAAIGIDAKGDKHPLGLAEGATENAATVQSLIDNVVERGLDPAVPRLFIIDGAKALSKAIRRTFRRAAAIQRCQIHKARNIMERLPKSLHASVRACCDKHGSWTTPPRPKGCFATSPSVSNENGRGSPARSWKASTKSSPSRDLDCRRSCGARSPVPTSSRMP